MVALPAITTSPPGSSAIALASEASVIVYVQTSLPSGSSWITQARGPPSVTMPAA